MIQIRTRPINTRPASPVLYGTRASSMRAALNSKYCMRAQLKTRTRVNGQDGYQTVTRQANEQSNGEYFSYQEGQHRVVADGQKTGNGGNGNDRLHLPPEIKITKTRHGKRWNTSSMEVELAKDILEVRDGLGKIVDATVLKPKV